MNLNSETQLVKAAQNGHLESFGVLYERYHSAMVALACSVIKTLPTMLLKRLLR